MINHNKIKHNNLLNLSNENTDSKGDRVMCTVALVGSFSMAASYPNVVAEFLCKHNA